VWKKMQKKYLFMLSFTFLIFIGVIVKAEEIKQKAQDYAEYNELVSNLTQVEYSGSGYWWVDFSRAMRYSGSILLDERGSPVKDENVTFIIVTGKIIEENYKKEFVEKWEEFSSSYRGVSENLRLIKNSLQDYDDQDSVVIHHFNLLMEDANEISDLSWKLSIFLNNSICSFSPDEAKKYLKYRDALIEKLKKTDIHYTNAINALQNLESDNKEKNQKEDLKEIARFIRKNQDSVKNTLEVMKSNKENLANAANLRVEEMNGRVETKEKESNVVIWVSLWIFSFLLLLIIIFLIKKH
jgi:Tat protein secretion system quality control protein TatD with DNase activity